MKKLAKELGIIFKEDFTTVSHVEQSAKSLEMVVLTDISKNRNISIHFANDIVFIEVCTSNEPITIATIEQPISDKLLLATIVKSITSYIVREEC